MADDAVVLSPSVMASFKVAKVFRDHRAPITSLDFDFTGTLCITSSEDDVLNLYDVRAGKHRQTCPSKKYGVDLARFVHHASHVLHASTKVDDTIRFLSLHDSSYVRYFKGHTGRVISLDVNPVNDTFLSGSRDGTVRLWDLRSNTAQGQMVTKGVPTVAYDPQGVVFAVGIDGTSVRLYDSSSFDKGPFKVFQLEKVRPEVRFGHLKFSGDGKYLLASTNADCIYILDAFDLVIKLVLDDIPNADGLVIEASWSPDSRFVLAGMEDGSVRIWDISNGAVVAKLPAHTDPCAAIRFSPRLACFASASAELALWLPENNGLPGPTGMSDVMT